MTVTYAFRQHQALGLPGGYYDILEQEKDSLVPHVIATSWSHADAALLVNLLNLITPEQRLAALSDLELEQAGAG